MRTKKVKSGKILSDLVVNDPVAFKEIVKSSGVTAGV